METATYEIRNNRLNKGQYIAIDEPCIYISMPRGEFRFLVKTIELMKITAGTAIMFSVNKKEKLVTIYKEEPQPDSYYPVKHRKDVRFTNKILANIVYDVFELDATKNQRFNCTQVNENLYQLTV